MDLQIRAVEPHLAMGMANQLRLRGHDVRVMLQGTPLSQPRLRLPTAMPVGDVAALVSQLTQARAA